MFNLKVILSNIFLFLFISVGNLCSEEIKVSFKGSTKSYSIKSLSKGELIYGSLNDLCNLLSYKIKNDKKTKFTEIDLNKGSIKISLNSSFIYLKSRTETKPKIVQIPVKFISKGQEIFFPAQYFVKSLSAASGINFKFDENKDILSINMAPPAKIQSSGNLFEFSGYKISKKANGYLIKFPSKSKLQISHSFSKEDNVVSIKINCSSINDDKLAKNKSNEIIEKIVTKEFPSSSEIQFHLNQEIVGYDVFQSDKTKDIHLLLFQKFSIDSMFKVERTRKKIEEIAETEKERDKWKLDVIVIDAGHGGKDPGCIGVTKKYEKNSALAIALKLGALLEKKLKVKVYYTRKTDTFIPLYRRGQIANEHKGNLFISIHCNSVNAKNKKKREVNGFETYILRPGRTQDAIDIAAQENAVIKYEEDYLDRYKKISDESMILTTIAQNAYVKFSEIFAESMSEIVSSKLKVKNRGVLQAGFYVLVGASMPSVLLEAGYLSNKKDETMLSTSSGQQKIADGIFEAIKNFKSVYEKSLQEGK